MKAGVKQNESSKDELYFAGDPVTAEGDLPGAVTYAFTYDPATGAATATAKSATGAVVASLSRTLATAESYTLDVEFASYPVVGGPMFSVDSVTSNLSFQAVSHVTCNTVLFFYEGYEYEDFLDSDSGFYTYFLPAGSAKLTALQPDVTPLPMTGGEPTINVALLTIVGGTPSPAYLTVLTPRSAAETAAWAAATPWPVTVDRFFAGWTRQPDGSYAFAFPCPK